MNKGNEIRISVRELVEFAYRSGDLDSRFTGMSRALEGAKLHRKLQSLNSEKAVNEGERYQKEISISYGTDYKGLFFLISGRIDGITENSLGTTLDEIKTVECPLNLIDEESYPVYWAQAKCYAFMYGVQKRLESINVQITYYNIDS
ncbi:MAG: hypothetical protein ACM3TR_09475 [Caulobacteraceae bacterium]